MILKSREAWLKHLSSRSVGYADYAVVVENNIVDGLCIPINDGGCEVKLIDESLHSIKSFHLNTEHNRTDITCCEKS